MSKAKPNHSADAPARSQVLVVDDEPQIRDMLRRMLGEAGYVCQSADGATQAWEILRACDIEAVILDITMPGGSGLELLGRVRAAFPRCEVVMLTAVHETGTAIEALSMGASAYLIKPVERKELLFHIRRAVERRQLQIDRDRHLQDLEQRVREQTRELQTAHEETIHRLMAASRYRDEETGAHIRRVGLLSEALAAALAWPAEQIDRIRMAAPMHDIGKIGIPDAILRKPGKLNQQEFEIMKTHSLIGARMLSGSDSPVLQMAEQIAYAHHEHWDGGGYPLGLVGNQIPACARLVAVVDVYDALTHARVYRPAMSEEDALAMIEAGRGTHFDPRCVSTFMEILPLIRQISSDNSDEASEQSGADHQKCLPVPHAPSTRGEGQSSLAHARRESVHCGHRSLIAGSSF